MIKNIYIFLFPSDIGGAELRFFGLCKEAKNNMFPITLVITQGLYDALNVKEKGRLPQLDLPIEIVDFGTGVTASRNAISSFVTKKCKVDDIVHFVDGNPLMKTQQKQVFSITQSSFKNLSKKGVLLQLVSAAFADRVDILDPKIYATLKKIFFFNKKKIHITSNSYCDVEKFDALPFRDKKDWFVFLGRFFHLKQVVTLINTIPEVYQANKRFFTEDFKFIFIGYGTQEAIIRERVAQPDFIGIPIEIFRSDQPQEVLKESRYFFSVQLNNNYPSRSLIEGMCAGNIPICTDVGNTRWIARPEFSYYVPEHFTSSNISNTLKDIATNSKEVLTQQSSAARQFVIDEHTISKMLEYYKTLYNTES